MEGWIIGWENTGAHPLQATVTVHLWNTKKKEVKDFETWQSPKKILETGNESLSQKLMQEQRNL